jgi:hypothetical protein
MGMHEDVERRLTEAGSWVLEPRTLDAAVLGCWTTEDGQVVALYDYHKLLDHFRNDSEDPDSEDALFEAEEWISYNVIRALPYLGENAPWVIVEVDDLEEEEEEDVYLTWEGRRWRKV